METHDYILAAYAVCALVILGMIVSTWLHARRVQRQLKQHDT